MGGPGTTLPLLATLRSYRSDLLKQDLGAGLTTAVMLVPQAMAYAMLAGLSPVVGLYAATVPTAIYALLGTSRVLAVGPVAMDSLLVAAAVAPLAGADPVAYAVYASLLMLLVGGLQFAMGMARLGFIVKYLSHSVIVGFSSAAALIIGFSQLKHVLGLPLERSRHIHDIVAQAMGQISEVHLPTLTLAATTVALLLIFKRRLPKFPRFLLVVALGAVAVWMFRLDQGGVAVVGDVPSGLPSFALPLVSLDVVFALFPSAIVISLVAFMEAIAVAKKFARKDGYLVDPNSELRAIGLANVGGSLFQGYPVTGGFSRTAVNAEAGAQTAVAGFITAAVVVLSLLFLTPLFYFLPKAVLAGIIMTAVFGLIDPKEAKRLYWVSKADFWLMVITFAATLGLGIETGVGVGVAASLLWFVAQNAKPHVAVLGYLPTLGIYRNVLRYPEAQTTDGVVVFRIDGPLFFANTAFLSDTVAELIDKSPTPVTAAVLHAGAIGSVDSAGASAVCELADSLRKRNIQLWLATVRGPVLDRLRAAGLSEVLPSEQIVPTVSDAMAVLRGAHEEATALRDLLG